MRFVFYPHSLLSDWNHGNAHFLRGVIRELRATGQEVVVLEKEDNWSLTNLLRDCGPEAVAAFTTEFSERPVLYGQHSDHESLIGDADVVIVHEWNDPALITELGAIRRRGGNFALLFHDTHHRAISARSEITRLDLAGYDAILTFGETLRQSYLKMGWEKPVHTWHEAADVALFKPQPEIAPDRDLIWIGNWGDGERSAELGEFLLEPARRLDLTGTIHGVRYPSEALAAIDKTRLDYKGWIANFHAPEAFARHRATVHVPRRPYATALPGIPTIRMFEALACGIPLVSAPWDDSEGLFRPGHDYLTARNGEEMARHLQSILSDTDLARALSAAGLKTILNNHTCRHRVDELFAILAALGRQSPQPLTINREAAQ
jgi:spore maturation protein CgeB